MTDNSSAEKKALSEVWPSAQQLLCHFHVLGTCSCWAGSQGAFCKHQALVQDTFGGIFPNSPKLTLEDRLQLGYLALGNRCPPPEFFQPLLPVLPNKAHDDEAVSEPLGALQGPQGHIGSQEAPTCMV